MKKQIIALSLGLMSIGIFAQKKELRAIDKAIDKNDFKTAKDGIAALESTVDAMDAKYKAQYYFLRGSAFGKSNVAEAADAYEKLFALEKENGKSKYTKEAKQKLGELTQFVSNEAIKQYNSKDYKNAKGNFFLTYKLSPKDTTFLYNAAVSASLDKDYDTSLKYYMTLKEIGYTGINTQYLAKNKASGVVEAFPNKSLRDLSVKTSKSHDTPSEKVSESKQSDIIKNISYIYINQGKTDEAITAIKEARESDPKDLNLLLNEAQLYIKLEQMDKFGALMEEAIKLDPNNPTLFFNLGVVNAGENKTEEAISYYKKAIELKPDYGDAYSNLAVSILSGEQAIIDEMNNNLSNFKKYDELEKKQKALYKKALSYLEKADEISRTEDTVKSLLNIYDRLEMGAKADAIRPIYKKMIGQ